ncbi:histamine H2 receptor-like [Stylophora pistillata]|uniref:histamine H2 receptor-like n=1 Tax=Stylophora pistillata TaxID=50429 RepID=UPI000C041F18|nr:histamine H2 receptor-like [Stylophora pistillata]
MEFNISITNITVGITIENSSFILNPEVTTIIVVFTLLALVIIPGNLLVLLSIRFNSRLRSPECILLLSLSVADLMVGLFLLPAKIVGLMSLRWARRFMWCDMTIFLTLFVLSASLLNLLGVAFDRCLAISYTLRYNSFMTVTKMCFAIVTLWLTAFTVAFLPLSGVGAKSVETQYFEHPCCFSDILEETYMRLYFVFMCAIPTALITTAYFKIFLLARNQARRITSLRMYIEELSTQNGGPINSHRPIRFARESKAARTVATVIGLFYLCWIPFFVSILLTTFKQEAVSYLHTAFVTCLAYSNSAFNPVIYGWLNQEFKTTYKRLVRGFLRFTRPSFLSNNRVTRIKKFSVRQTVTATISATQSEKASQNFRPIACCTRNL